MARPKKVVVSVAEVSRILQAVREIQEPLVRDIADVVAENLPEFARLIALGYGELDIASLILPKISGQVSVEDLARAIKAGMVRKNSSTASVPVLKHRVVHKDAIQDEAEASLVLTSQVHSDPSSGKVMQDLVDGDRVRQIAAEMQPAELSSVSVGDALAGVGTDAGQEQLRKRFETSWAR